MILLNETHFATYNKYAARTFPRHTSYPAANLWIDAWDISDFHRMLQESTDQLGEIALYFHVLFCEKLCLYCGCNRSIVTKEQRKENDPSEQLVYGLIKEMEYYRPSLPKHTSVGEIHLGGGTPTFLTPSQLIRLFKKIRELFQVKSTAEISVEIDPRTTTTEHLHALYECGVRRLSLGVQDFDPKVQYAIGRIQPFEIVKELIERIRKIGFTSVNFDLIYGLPHQTRETLQRTIRLASDLRPDRIALFKLAYLPKLLKWQRSMPVAEICDSESCFQMFVDSINLLDDHGYKFIGLDHFVKPEDPLYRAFTAGNLQRNFQGMTATNLPIIGFGPTAITTRPRAYSQNTTDYKKWLEGILEENPRFQKGYHLDSIVFDHRSVINRLYCYGTVDEKSLAEVQIDADRRSYLHQLQNDGLIELSEDGLKLTAFGKLMPRVVAVLFDRTLPHEFWTGEMNQLYSAI